MFDLPGLAMILIGYLIGSIPFGLVLTRVAGLGDVRSIGSGNIGATNVLRTGNKALAATTLFLDIGKGVAAVLLAQTIAPEAAVMAGGAAFLGHLYPVWLKFMGGKGVATFLGILLAAAWPVGLACSGTWLLSAFLLRISSLAALVAAALSPIYAYFMAPADVMILAMIMAALIFLRHAANIRRLAAGTEPKIGDKKPETENTTTG